MMKDETPTEEQTSGILGICFVGILFITYGGYLILCAYAPHFLASEVSPGSPLTFAFIYGYFIIGLGACLTGIYAFIANRRETRATGRGTTSLPSDNDEVRQ